MVTAEEIRARVEQADRARIQIRADAAGKVATALARRTEAAQQLAVAEAAITAALGEAGAVMTLDELAEFTGGSVREFRRLAGTKGTRRRQPANRRRNTTTAPQRTAPASAQDSAAE